MASCDLCGKPATTRSRIEGAIMNACASCATFGTELSTPKPAGKVLIPKAKLSGHASFGNRRNTATAAADFVLAGDFGLQLRAARQRLKLTEEEAAFKLQISKHDLLHYESGKLQPIESMTRKLEKFYGITLTISV